jgi:membrane-associated phospholipid phosphatase
MISIVRRVALWTTIACVVAFAILTWNVVAGSGLAGLDDDVERVVVAHRVGWATAILKILTWLGSSVVLWPVVGVVAVLLITRGRRWRWAMFLVLAMAGSGILTDVVKRLVERPRPPTSLSLVHVTGTAYPSGHAMDAMAVYVALRLVLSAGWSKKAGALFTCTAGLAILIVGWSRLYLGTHWLTDVLGAYALGGLWVSILGLVLLRPGAAPARTAPYPPGPGP